MKTLADLELELKSLRRRVTELGGDPDAENQAAVNEIVGDGTVSAGGRGKFSVECGKAGRATAAQALVKAREALVQDPTQVRTAAGQAHFFKEFEYADINELRNLVERANAVGRPQAQTDSPAAESREFVRRSR